MQLQGWHYRKKLYQISVPEDFLISYLLTSPPDSTPNIPEYELQALHNLYDATNGDSWVWKAVSGERWRFTENANPCDPGWKGITCTLPPPYTTYFVQGIDLFAYKLNGTLPNSIGVFSQLQFIDFIGNIFLGFSGFLVWDFS